MDRKFILSHSSCFTYRSNYTIKTPNIKVCPVVFPSIFYLRIFKSICIGT